MGIMIRKGKEEDAEKIIQHCRQVFGETDCLLSAPEEFIVTAQQERQWIKGFEQDRHLLLVAEADGELIGILSFEASGGKRASHTGFLGISIQQAYTGKGLGKKMMEMLLEWAEKEPGLEKLCLNVMSHNEPAIHLYKKLGFQEEGRRMKQIKNDDGTYYDEIAMYKFVK